MLPTLDQHPPREQAGFRSGFSTIDHVVSQLQEKTSEHKIAPCFAFVDYERAFDSVERIQHRCLHNDNKDFKSTFSSERFRNGSTATDGLTDPRGGAAGAVSFDSGATSATGTAAGSAPEGLRRTRLNARNMTADITPTMGFSALLTGIVASVVGGVGSIAGAMIGALLIAAVQNLSILVLPSHWQDATVFGVLIAFLLARPQGFFGLPVTKAEI